MNRKIHKTVIPLVWLFISFFTIPLPLSGYVLCVGADGHIEFEAATNGRCADVQPFKWGQSTVVLAEVASPEDHCGLCLDIPISVSDSDPHSIVPTPEKSPDFSAMAFTTNPQTTFTVIPIRNYPLNIPPRINPTLISLRTTILLT